MRFLHLSDIHIGKQLHGYDLLAEQKEILQQILQVVKEEKPDALIIAGDIYDRSVPSGEAMGIFDDFLVSLSHLPFTMPVLIIAGNHDSPERLQYGKNFLKSHQIYISTMPPQDEKEHLEKVTLCDAWGEVDFYLLPFIKPGMVRHYMPQEAAEGEQSIIRALLEREQIDWNRRNVLLAHQFFVRGEVSPVVCDSEQIRLQVGGLDAVDCQVVQGFDYVALGHLHSPQSIGTETVRYCGTPLQYSVSEAGQEKSLTLVELEDKEDGVRIQQIPLRQSHPVRKLKGSIEELIALAGQEKNQDYVSITLTQEDIADNPRELLEPYFERILEIRVDNERIRHALEETVDSYEQLDPLEAFELFFEESQGRKINEEEKEVVTRIIQEVIGRSQ